MARHENSPELPVQRDITGNRRINRICQIKEMVLWKRALLVKLCTNPREQRWISSVTGLSVRIAGAVSSHACEGDTPFECNAWESGRRTRGESTCRESNESPKSKRSERHVIDESVRIAANGG